MTEDFASIGERLRAAREAQGLAVEQVAARLRLMNRQVAAMESGDFAVLGQAVFARGFVRNYAKLLGLDAEEIVAQMGGRLSPESVPKTDMRPLRVARRWRTAWLWGVLAVAVLFVFPIGLYFWLNSGGVENVATSVHVATAPNPVVPTKPATSAAASLAAPQMPAVSSPAFSGSQVTSAVALHFLADTWLEVHDAQGKQLAHGLYHAGQEVTFAQGFPLRFLIGNAAQTSVSYDGHVLDLRPYTNVNVARFSVAADGTAKALTP